VTPLLSSRQVEGWVSEWLDVWERLAFCDFWSSHWMYLLARTAKDDWKGASPATSARFARPQI
jgi:hypothetical protein